MVIFRVTEFFLAESKHLICVIRKMYPKSCLFETFWIIFRNKTDNKNQLWFYSLTEWISVFIFELLWTQTVFIIVYSTFVAGQLCHLPGITSLFSSKTSFNIAAMQGSTSNNFLYVLFRKWGGGCWTQRQPKLLFLVLLCFKAWWTIRDSALWSHAPCFKEKPKIWVYGQGISSPKEGEC